MRGGFNPNLISTDFGHASASFLASEHGMAKRIGITMDADLMTADSNGNKYLMAGTAIGKVTASGLYGPYNNGLSDGRQTGVGLLEHDVNLKYGDVTASIMIHGSAIEDRCIGVDANFKSDVPNIIFQ
jgi:hypothetical protein